MTSHMIRFDYISSATIQPAHFESHSLQDCLDHFGQHALPGTTAVFVMGDEDDEETLGLVVIGQPSDALVQAAEESGCPLHTI